MVSLDPDNLRLNAREALLSRSLSHPHLVQTYAIHVSQLQPDDLDPATYVPSSRAAAGQGGAVRPATRASLGDDETCSAQVNALLATALLSTMDEEAGSGRRPAETLGSSGGTACFLGTLEAAAAAGRGNAGDGEELRAYETGATAATAEAVDATGPAVDSGAAVTGPPQPQPGGPEAALEPLLAAAPPPPSRRTTTGAGRARSGVSTVQQLSHPHSRLHQLSQLSTFSTGPVAALGEPVPGAELPTTAASSGICSDAGGSPVPRDCPAAGADGQVSRAQGPDRSALRFLDTLHCMGAAPGCYLIVVLLEYCEHGTLAQLIQDQAATSAATAEPEVASGSGQLPGLRRRRRPPPVRPLKHSCSDPSLAWAPLTARRTGSAGAGMMGTGLLAADGGSPASGSAATLPKVSGAVTTGTAGMTGGDTDSGGPSPAATGSERALEMLRNALEIAQAMVYLHSLDLVHGDLKPGNVLLRAHAETQAEAAAAAGATPGGGAPAGSLHQRPRGYVCKVADFGLTNPVAATGSLPRATNASGWGAISYIAPEVVVDGKHGKPADVYSYGALLWHMVTGRPAFATMHPAQVLVGLASGDLALEMPPGVEPTVRKIGAACLARDPERRPTFDRIVAALLKAVPRTAQQHSRLHAAGNPPAGGGGGGGSFGAAAVSSGPPAGGAPGGHAHA
ncbi:hypothetical protein GPECTOR_5g28 [Gonium pectorale]|uniref:Protein kinase domain-containing protein n=1 Tax=Gonium pectorale TaxID=33097 RepID=A0A150GWK4_GONPE|nr:hypothetical protein GPECTOR_5g28 [Gonium pectorale]|eukprot:KXZ54184.1 hypothetical protein GPECTOR_5g28 [Gonium pectorale]